MAANLALELYSQLINQSLEDIKTQFSETVPDYVFVFSAMLGVTVIGCCAIGCLKLSTTSSFWREGNNDQQDLLTESLVNHYPEI